MEAIKIEKTTIVPFRKEKQLDLTFVTMANEHAELLAREQRAREYSALCKAKKQKQNRIDSEDIWGFLSALSMFGFIYIMYMFMCIIG